MAQEQNSKKGQNGKNELWTEMEAKDDPIQPFLPFLKVGMPKLGYMPICWCPNHNKFKLVDFSVIHICNCILVGPFGTFVLLLEIGELSVVNMCYAHSPLTAAGLRYGTMEPLKVPQNLTTAAI